MRSPRSVRRWSEETMAGSKIYYHFDEVAKHNDAEDCWVIVSGKVPNLVTSPPFYISSPLALRDHAVGFKSFGPSSLFRSICSGRSEAGEACDP
ncbi:hypothetical protein BHE74_00058803 [Ensete ventricosum]|nr:hypothetical protein GW17_00047500 [Ensete ventricosum]RWW36193.1 hypothetical protein BHE74_00058803 [Ensete ventricosum]